jgi:glycosyltransferase involved in cell wall biosynthesis
VVTVAYLANQFPSPVEPYVGEEIQELLKKGIVVVAGTVRRPGPGTHTNPREGLDLQILCLQPLRLLTLLLAVGLLLRQWKKISGLLTRALFQGKESPKRRAKTLIHTFLGAYYAVQLRSYRVDHIHAHHGYFGSWIAMAAALLLDANFSLTLHGSDLLLNGAYLDLKLKNCQFCVTISDYNRRYILHRFPNIDAGKILVSRLGVDVPLTTVRTRVPLVHGSRHIFTMLTVGRLHPVKDHAFLIHACARLRDHGLNFDCIIAGEGPERERLESLIQRHHLQDRVRLLGHVAREQVRALYERADLVVLTSRSEGLPLVLMEAMACCKIVLAPAITGVPELVIPGKTGFLYIPGASSDFLAKILFLHEQLSREDHGAKSRLAWVRYAARVHVIHNFNRKKNLSLSLVTNFFKGPRFRIGVLPMRILFCNKYNYPFSGTEAYLFEVMELMRRNGHEVALFSMADARGQPTPYDRHFVPHIDFKNPRGCVQNIRLGLQAIYSSEARQRIRSMIAEFKPDVAHVRNIYHHLSPSILWELKAQKVPVIYHLNDFKVLCPSYNLVAHGEACEACKGGNFWHALKTRCYPGWGASLLLAAEAYVHKWLGTYRKCVDCFLAPSQFVRDKFVEHGWDPAKFEVLSHFQRDRSLTSLRAANAPVLYFGRLSAEKGVADLLHAMRRLPEYRLVVAGDGPERGRLQEMAGQLGLQNVQFAGKLHGVELDRAIVGSCFTVLPSHAYETFGKTILESYAQARTVIATDLGSRRELVQEGKTGLLYETGNVGQLTSAIQFLRSRPELADEMGRAGREQVGNRNRPQAHYDALISLYERVIEGGQQTPGGRKTPIIRVRPSAATPKRALRIAFIGGRGVISKYSGIETYYEQVGSRLADMGHEVTAYCRTYFTPPQDRHKGIRIVRLPTLRWKHLETLVHTLLSTLHVLTQPCDVVHYHALGPALFSFIPRLMGKQTVVTVQGLDWQRRKWGHFASTVLQLGERAAVRFPTQTMVVSKALQNHYRTNYEAKTIYVPNGGVLRERRLPDKIAEWGLEAGKYILFLGRFSPEKGCHLLIEAYEKLDTPVKLVLAGASSYCDDYSSQLRKHAGDRIKILDWVSGGALDELLTNAMLFVLPSDMEGLSLALLDAMGAGLCVLSSDIPENREAVADAGFTFRRGDVADLADRLRFLIANPTVREAAGVAAKRSVYDTFLWSNIATAVERVYFEAINETVTFFPAKKPSGRAEAEVASIERRAG